MLRVVVLVEYLLDDLPLLIDVYGHLESAVSAELLQLHGGLGALAAHICEVHFYLELRREALVF